MTHIDLNEAVDSALDCCHRELAKMASKPANYALLRDLRIGVQALELIQSELCGKRPRRPKGQRSAIFTRYVIDESEQMVMAPELRDLIVQIENTYSRYEE